MLFLIVATFCTLAGCGGVCCLNTLLLPTFRECAEENEITKDVLQNVRKDIEEAMPGDDVKVCVNDVVFIRSILLTRVICTVFLQMSADKDGPSR